MSDVATLPRFSGSGYAARLQRRGFEVIGRGGGYTFDATFVLAKPGSDRVVKVGTYPAGDPYPRYAAWCLRNPGALRPVIHHLAWHGARHSRFFVVTMDRLSASLADFNQPNLTPEKQRIMRANDDLSRRLIHALHYWYEMTIALGIDRRDWHTGPMDPKLVHRLVKRLAKVGLEDVAKFVRTLSATFPMLRMDPQPCNWMFTADGKLVMIDPFTRTLADVPETASRLLKA
jgi:hypothetical protein